MAHSCVSSTSSASATLRFNSLAFSANSTSRSEPLKSSLLPFELLRSRDLRRSSLKFQRNSTPKAVYSDRIYQRNSTPKAVYSDRIYQVPQQQSSRKGIWSIRDDLVVPSSPFFPIRGEAAQGPPPMVQERFGSVISQLFQHRIIRCGGAVEDEMANMLVAQLLYLDAMDPKKDIVMYINSPGGSVTAGMAIFDTMRHIRPDVSTICVGLAASMGAFLLSAGTKGKRYSLPNSRIMIHQPLGGAQGSVTEIEIQAHEMLHHKSNLAGYLAYHTGQSFDQIHIDTDRDYFMSPKEAQEYGMIDGIIMNPMKAFPPITAAVDQ